MFTAHPKMYGGAKPASFSNPFCELIRLSLSKKALVILSYTF